MQGFSEKLVKKVTDEIIAKIEDGNLPPWSPGHTCTGTAQRPYNLKSKRPYRGSNIFFLYLHGFTCPAWNTFKAWNAMDVTIQKGEHGVAVVGWFPKETTYDTKDTDDQGHETIETKTRLRWVSYVHTVFNAEQTTMKEEELAELMPKASETFDTTSLKDAEAIFDNYKELSGVNFKHRQGYGAYNHVTDTIKVAPMKFYKTSSAYYSTLFHEAVHSTGHKTRLDRLHVSYTHDENYSKEELVAEMGASLLCMYIGISNEKQIDNQAAYLKGWLTKLKSDPSLIITAGNMAQKAIDMILEKKEA
jgi:antirestriction protein ArdC